MNKAILWHTFLGMGVTCASFVMIPTPTSQDHQKEQPPLFTLPPLAYEFDALEPYIDAKTMQIHYEKHHQSYVNKLNEALKKYPKLQSKSLVELLTNLDHLPESIRLTIQHNGGGHFAHSLYWSIMSPQGGGKPTGKLAEAIFKRYGSFYTFRDAFWQEASSLFGSGWTWLCTNSLGKLKIISTSGHDIPFDQGFTPIFVIDVWEHAYYLKHQNRRDEHIKAWWNVVNWPQVEKNYIDAIAEKHDA